MSSILRAPILGEGRFNLYIPKVRAARGSVNAPWRRRAHRDSSADACKYIERGRLLTGWCFRVRGSLRGHLRLAGQCMKLRISRLLETGRTLIASSCSLWPFGWCVWWRSAAVVRLVRLLPFLGGLRDLIRLQLLRCWCWRWFPAVLERCLKFGCSAWFFSCGEVLYYLWKSVSVLMYTQVSWGLFLVDVVHPKWIRLLTNYTDTVSFEAAPCVLTKLVFCKVTWKAT